MPGIKRKIYTFIQESGLGLSLFQSIIPKWGRGNSVIQVAGQGSTFWLTLPWKVVLGTEKSDGAKIPLNG